MVLNMANNVKAEMADALEAVAQEAVEEFESQPEGAADDVGDEDAEAADADGGETAPDEPHEADGETDDDGAEVDQEDVSDSWAWDGNPASVKPEHLPYYKVLEETTRKGAQAWMSRHANEFSAKERAYQEQIRHLQSEALEGKRAALEPKLPPVPGPDASQDQIDAYYDARSKLAAFQQFKELQEAGLLPRQAQQQASTIPDQAAVDRRVQLIQSQPGFSEEIAVAMVEASRQNPYWAEQLQRDEGALALFHLVKTQAEAAQLKQAAAKANTAELQRKASSVTRKVSKPKAAPAKVAPHRNWADMTLEGALEAVSEDVMAEFGK